MFKYKISILIVVIFYFFNNVNASLKSDTIDVIHYTINLDFANNIPYTISGNTELETISKMQGLNYVCLDLLKLTVDSVFINEVSATFSHNDTLLKIILPLSFHLNDTFKIHVYYQGYPAIDPSGWGGFYFSSGYSFNLGV